MNIASSRIGQKRTHRAQPCGGGDLVGRLGEGRMTRTRVGDDSREEIIEFF
ncbi:hypothetical protein PILCRDRAFT_820208, partial [Piloderma croceum F 1598]